MANRGAHAFQKRKKEMARKERQKAKAERRAEREETRRQRAESGHPDEDPDIAGIVPGPQPPVEDEARGKDATTGDGTEWS